MSFKDGLMDTIWDFISENLEAVKDEYELWDTDEITVDWVIDNFDMDELRELCKYTGDRIKYLEEK